MVLQNAYNGLAEQPTLLGIKTDIDLVTDITSPNPKMKVGTIQDRLPENFITFPNASWTVVQTGAGQVVSVAGATGGSRYLNIAAGTTINSETIIESVDTFSFPFRLQAQVSISQRIANQEFYIEMVGVDGASAVEADGTGPLNQVAFKFDSTSANNAGVQNRSGNSIFAKAAASFGTGATTATGSGPNFLPAFEFNILGLAERVMYFSTAVDSTAVGTSSAVVQQIPSPLKRYKIRIRSKNLGSAPASNTDFRVHQIRLLDQTRFQADILGGIGRTDPAGSVPITGTVGVSGTVTTTLATAVAVTADGLAGPTTAPVAANTLYFNGTTAVNTWDRARNNHNFTVDASSAKVATGNGTTAVNYNAAGAKVFVAVTAVSGTTPTLVVKLQESYDGTNWVDIPGAVTPTINANGTYVLTVYPGVAAVANQSVPLPLPRLWRCVWTIGGGTPSFTFATIAAYIL